MEKLWTGRFHKPLSETADAFNSSIAFDSRMYQQDIEGSIAHTVMLSETGIISEEDAKKITEGLKEILQELDQNLLHFDDSCEDIHTFVEKELTKRIGEVGKRLHTARSRNDQVALDIRMYLKKECKILSAQIKELIEVILKKSSEYAEAIMPGYTHLQRAQPITFGHHLMAYTQMFLRDRERLADCLKRIDTMPLGCCALAGTTYPIDRQLTASLLGFKRIAENSLDGVSDRDFLLEFCSDLSILMMHLSRFCEEIILWCSWEYHFMELDDAFSTGSSIMPQKKNPDMAELIRGKTGRVYGNMVAVFTLLKGLPLAYNKDMQEDKEAVFDSLDTVKQCLEVFIPMLGTLRMNQQEMRKAAETGFINATDLADYLVKKGIPFRSAYQVVGDIVTYCVEKEKILEEITLEEYRKFHSLFEEDVYQAINMEECVRKRNSYGGTDPDSVRCQIEKVREQLRDS